MAYKIILRLKDKTGTVKVEYECRNLQNFDHSIQMPTSTFGLPEDYLEKAIITKADGNTGKLVFTWVVKDEDTTPFNVMTSWNLLWPSSSIDPAPHANVSNNTTYYSRKVKTVADDGYQSFSLLTADGQMIALGELFEKRGFTGEDRHEIILRNTSASPNYDIYNQSGLITRFSFQKAGAAPVTWNVTFEFQLGDVFDSTS